MLATADSPAPDQRGLDELVVSELIAAQRRHPDTDIAHTLDWNTLVAALDRRDIDTALQIIRSA